MTPRTRPATSPTCLTADNHETRRTTTESRNRVQISKATHLGEANVSASVIMAKTGHKSLRSLQRYVKPGLAAVHAATETLSSPRRRG